MQCNILWFTQQQKVFVFSLYVQVYNDADILEKIVKEKQKELGPLPEEEDVGSPKLKLRVLCHLKEKKTFADIVTNFVTRL